MTSLAVYCQRNSVSKAANNIVVVCRLHHINTLKQALNGTKAYEETSTDEKTVVNSHSNDLPYKFAVNVKERQDKLLTMYWFPKLLERPYKVRFIANSSSCTTTELSKLLTSCLSAIKSRVIRYYKTVYERSRENVFCSIKKYGEVLNKFKSSGFRATSLSTYDVSTLYTTLPHNLVNENLLDLIEGAFKTIFKNEGTLYLACNDKLWSCQNVCDSLKYRISWIIFTSYLVISYTDKLLVFQWVQIVLLL